MKRLLPTLVLPLALLAAGCGGGSAAKSSTISGDGTDGKGSVTLNVGDQKGGAEAVLRAAGELKGLDYRIKWSTFTSGPPLLEAVNAGAVDIGNVGNTPPVFAAAAGSKIKVVGAANGSAKGDAILVPKGSPIRKVSQLKGKSVAVAQGSSAHYQLVTALQKAGLSPKDVKFSFLQPADALAAFSSKKVDAWSIWDPFTSQALASANGRFLSDGEGTVDGVDLSVAAPAALSDKKKEAAVKDYIGRLRKAQDWVYKHPEAWAKVWSKETGLPYEVALDSVKRSNGTRVPVAVDQDFIAAEQKIVDTFAQLKLIPKRFEFDAYADGRYNAGLPPYDTKPRTYGKGN
ncbi:ABC transporter substrate-binding protein [Streptomyces sp. A7024]|uniref:Putative aliphatic sulfonates-binding protein n=1 Tax=Streptomyces coryli TaxID=1128680 RepID=A0A6G4UEU3_9ACTN|nr:ABC transporter substrate-binding protein [Streptomyces coryli]NGN70208.1 ABC transporter substrate-binding protein [Streptomyces coryli]